MATCTEFKNDDYPTDEDLSVSCGEANVSAGPVSLSNGASMNLSNTGSFNLQDLSTTDGGNITISVGGDLTLNNVTCGADLTLVASGILTLNGALNVKGKISMQSGGDFKVNQTISQEEGEFTIQSGGELMINQSITQQEAGTAVPIDISATGKITISGPIKGQMDVSIESTGDMLQIDATVEGAGEMNFKAPSGEVMITKDITQQDGSFIGTMRIDAGRKITVNGQVTGKKNILIESTGNMIQVDKSIIYDGDSGEEDRIELKTANENIKVTKPINAGGAFVRFTANGGMIDVTANILAPNNSAVFVADQEVKLSTVDVSGNAQIGDDFGGSIQIMANKSGSGGIPFTIGGSGHSNGVNGRLIARTATGGGSDPERWSGGVLVFNKGTGGIKLDSSTDIVVRATNSKNGVIVLDADEGSVEMPEGTISVNGQGGKSAGLISLLGSNINFTGSGKTILTASDTVSSGGLQHTIALAAENITFTSADGLELRANGDGDSTWISAVDLFPKGGLKVIIIPSGAGFQYTVEPQNGFDGTDAPLNINGPGNLNITANGSNSQIRATGNPVNFNVQGNVEFVCNGKENNNIAVTYSGNSGQGLTVSSPTNLEFLANGLDDGDGGTITFSMPSIDLNTALSLTCRANGIGPGKGGAVIFNATNGSVNSVDDSLLLELIANGGQSGGDGGSVSVGASQDVTLVGATCRANGAGTGKGGTVTLNASQLASIAGCTITGSSDVEGDGGTVNIFGETIRVNELESTNPTAIRAAGGISTGSGGQINVNAQSAISVSDNVTITASALGNGFGGDISLVSVSQGVDLQGSGINILSKGAGVGVGASGDGGIITIKGNESGGDISLEALIDASAGDIGDGGDITITGGIVNLGTLPIRAVGGSTSGKGGRVDINASTIEDAGALIHVFAETDGDGGIINLLLTGMEAVVLTDSTVLNASGGVEQGNGGSINIFAKGLFTVSQFTTVNTNARAANNAKGGTIIVVMEDTFFLNGKLLANSGDNGDGGLIVINTAELNVMNGEIRASGNNGIINIFNGPENNRPFRFTKTSTDQERGVIAANGPIDGALSAGSISISNAKGEIIVDSAYALRANSSSNAGDEEPGTANNAPGGSISITSDSAKVTINGIVAANGSGTGRGGTIVLNIPELDVVDGQIRANGNEGIISIVDNSGGGTGSAGAFNFQKPGSDSMAGVLAANAGTGGPAGIITLNNPKGPIKVETGFVIRANGSSGNNKGGSINILTAEGKLTVSGSLVSDGEGTGDRGDITIDVKELDLSGARLQSLSGSSSKELRGLLVTAEILSDLSSKAVLNVSGKESGNGGLISINKTDITNASIIKLGSSGNTYEVRATGGSSSGDGGFVFVNAPVLTEVKFEEDLLVGANQNSNEGEGGEIRIEAGTITGGDSGTSLNVDGKGINNGGKINLKSTLGDINLDNESGGLKLSANGLGNGDGGSITLESNGEIRILAANISASNTGSGENAKGGNISILSNRTGTSFVSASVRIRGELKVNGKGSERGGTISVEGDNLDLEDSVIQADGGQTGIGGNISVTSKNFRLVPELGSLGLRLKNTKIEARGGSQATATGNIILESSSTIDIDPNSVVDVSGLPGSAGNAGAVQLTSGNNAIFANDGEIIVNGSIKASGVNGSTTAGEITFRYNETFSRVKLGPNSLVEANSTNGSGEIRFENTTGGTGGTLRVGGPLAVDAPQGTISAPTGILIFSQSNNFPVEINVLNLFGRVASIAGSIDLRTGSSNDLLLDDFELEDNAKIKFVNAASSTGLTGSISQQPGKRLLAKSLDVEVIDGSIGSAGSPILTGGLETARLVNSTDGSGDIFVSNNQSDLLTLESQLMCGGKFSIDTNGTLVTGSIESGDDLTLKSLTGELRLLGSPNSTVLDSGGAVSLQGSTKVVVATSSNITAHGDITVKNGETVIQTCSQSDNNEPSCAPSGVDGTVLNQGAIHWGTDLNITGSVFATADSRTITFHGNGNEILIQSNSAFNALL